jgi:hypothetical protein
MVSSSGTKGCTFCIKGSVGDRANEIVDTIALFNAITASNKDLSLMAAQQQNIHKLSSHLVETVRVERVEFGKN